MAWVFVFFFSSRRRHTRFDCDWSSDVCSSDLVVDRDAESLAVARRACADYPEIRLVLADAAALPVREGVADVVTSALTLHHLEPDGAVASLREMAAAARRAVIVNDLLRTRLAFGLVWLATESE